ncbi:hypothetical protein J2S89_000273 [Arthrobacter bambusae]|nr:hypothetical protein [Arthrobacter bambusae]MDQ0096740.1 hypothetical protein [Arthrobacter bambusae]
MGACGGKVWDFIRSQPGLWTGGHNIFVYGDPRPDPADTETTVVHLLK